MKITKSFFKLVLWSFLFPILAVLLLHIFHRIFPNFIQSYGDLTAGNRLDFDEISKWRLILDACIIAPLVEEIVFRGNISRKFYFHYLALITSLIFLGLTFFDLQYKNGFYFFLYSLLVLILKIFTKNNFPKKLMLLISSIAFGFIHISNLDNTDLLNSFSYIVYILPLTIFGFFLGLIRIRHGLQYSILVHFFKNSIAIIFLLT